LAQARDGADDAAVIRASLTDPERFAILVRRHAPAIQRYITRRRWNRSCWPPIRPAG
jgi:hypothetical protein